MSSFFFRLLSIVLYQLFDGVAIISDSLPGFPQHKSTMAGDYCFSKWVTCSVDEKHLKHTFSAVVWTGPGELAPRPRRSRKRPLPGLFITCMDTFHHVHGRFASSVKLCLVPCLLYKKCSQSCPRHTFLLVEQTGSKIRSLFKCRKHWASDLKMRSVVFANSRYVR